MEAINNQTLRALPQINMEAHNSSVPPTIPDHHFSNEEAISYFSTFCLILTFLFLLISCERHIIKLCDRNFRFCGMGYSGSMTEFKNVKSVFEVNFNPEDPDRLNPLPHGQRYRMNQLMSTFHDNLGIMNEVRKSDEVKKPNIYIEKATKEEMNSLKEEQKAKQLPNT